MQDNLRDKPRESDIPAAGTHDTRHAVYIEAGQYFVSLINRPHSRMIFIFLTVYQLIVLV
jgi:hypothetical protein